MSQIFFHVIRYSSCYLEFWTMKILRKIGISFKNFLSDSNDESKVGKFE